MIDDPPPGRAQRAVAAPMPCARARTGAGARVRPPPAVVPVGHVTEGHVSEGHPPPRHPGADDASLDPALSDPEIASLRIASFGFRHLPPRVGCAGADKFVLELLPRLAARGHRVVGYNRAGFGEKTPARTRYRGVEIRTVRTFRKPGLEALWHAACVTFDIIRHNRADVVHIQNGGNSPFGAILRLFGKRTVLTEDGKEWERGKWSPPARGYLRAMTWLSARVHSEVVFDNVFARAEANARAGRRFALIHYGAEVDYQPDAQFEAQVLDRLGLTRGGYFLFVGRFIPDKGLHHLVTAFAALRTDKKLVLVGGAAEGSAYAAAIRASDDPRIVLPGYLYGADAHVLMRHCFAYVQPSDLEGLSPVILEAAYLGAPVICSDIEMNRYALGEHGLYFAAGQAGNLRDRLAAALAAPELLRAHGVAQQRHVADTYSWERIADQYLRVFANGGVEQHQ